MIKKKSRKFLNKRRHTRIRKKISGTAQMPRLVIFRSARHIYAQLINDQEGKTLVSANTLQKDLASKIKDEGSKLDRAKAIGKLLAEKAKQAGIEKAVFDRGGYKYHGRVAALAEGAREGGLEF
ncbi:MAG: 50S ribosomal protein L18 [Vulcanimicrobiota bacterium]